MSELEPGIVMGCYKLKVFEEPDEKSEVLGEITALTKLMVDREASTEDFYNVCTSAGIEGFCKRDYIVTEP